MANEKLPEFLIADIMPTQEVHLLCGPSGAGKSTMLFQMLAAWQNGRPVLGHASFPVPYTYVSCDRSLKSVTSTLSRLGLTDEITRIVTLDDMPEGHGIDLVASTTLDKFPDTQLLVIEGIQTFTGNHGKDYGSVSAFLRRTFHKHCKAGLTILGTGHSPKVKQNEQYVHPREKALGSVAWGAFSDLIIIIDLDDKTRVRTVSVLPRNSAEEQFSMMSGPGGMLIPCPREKGERLMLVIMSRNEGSTITTAAVLQIAEDMEISHQTAERTIAKAVEDGTLERLEEGVYKRPYTA